MHPRLSPLKRLTSTIVVLQESAKAQTNVGKKAANPKPVTALALQIFRFTIWFRPVEVEAANLLSVLRQDSSLFTGGSHHPEDMQGEERRERHLYFH